MSTAKLRRANSDGNAGNGARQQPTAGNGVRQQAAAKPAANYMALTESAMKKMNQNKEALKEVAVSIPPQTDSRPGNMKLITLSELLKVLITIASALFGLLAMQYPNETSEERKKRGTVLWGLAGVYVLCLLCKMKHEYVTDRAYGMFYLTRSNGRKVFYAKFVQHVFSVFVMFGTILCSTLSSLDFDKVDAWTLYKASMVSGVLSMVYSVTQSLGAEKVPVLVRREKRSGRRIGYKLSQYSETAPRGRYTFYVSDKSVPVPMD